MYQVIITANWLALTWLGIKHRSSRAAFDVMILYVKQKPIEIIADVLEDWVVTCNCFGRPVLTLMLWVM